jgi:hypothetical protein
MKEASFLRVSIIDPISGKQKQKQFSLNKYTREEAERLGEEWKKSIILPDPEPTVPIIKAPSKPTELFPLQDFNIKTPDNFPKFGISMMFLATTRAGKTTLMNYVLQNYFSDFITVLHTNSAQNDVYNDIRKTVIECPTYMPRMMKETMKINKHTHNKYKFLHYVDDIPDKRHDKQLLRMLTYGRNMRNSCIISAQELSIMNNISRSNINYVICMKLGNDTAIEKVIKAYLRSWFTKSMTLNDCIRAYKELTEDHQFFVIDNIHSSIFLSKLHI